MSSRIAAPARLALLVVVALLALVGGAVRAQVSPQADGVVAVSSTTASSTTAPARQLTSRVDEAAAPRAASRAEDALPGRALPVDAAPPLADDHGTRRGARLAHAAVDPHGETALLFAEPRAFLLHLGALDDPLARSVRVPTEAPLAMGSFWGPRVARHGERVTVVGVLTSQGGRAGDVFAWVSADAGANFAEPVRLNAHEGAAQERIVELAAGADGRLAVAWMHSEGGVVSLRGVTSRDLGATWSDERVLHASASGSVCPCCPPTLAWAADGDALWAVFRDDVDGFRDNYLLRLDEPGATPRRLGAPRWEIAGCPMSVPALRVDAGGPLAVYRRDDALFEARAPTPAAPDVLPEVPFGPEPGAPTPRWPLLAALRDPAGDAAWVRFWRRDAELVARVPGAFLDTELGRARRVVLADTPDPGGPLLLAAELDDGHGGWRLSLRLLQDVAR